MFISTIEPISQIKANRQKFEKHKRKAQDSEQEFHSNKTKAKSPPKNNHPLSSQTMFDIVILNSDS